MDGTRHATNILDLERELDWLTALIDTRLRQHFGPEAESALGLPPVPASADGLPPPPPDLSGSDSPFAAFVAHYGFAPAERAALILALTPRLRPQLLDCFFARNRTFDRDFTEFGGMRDPAQGRFVPTGETLAFILGGTALAARFAVAALLHPDHAFARHHLLTLERGGGRIPHLQAAIAVDEDLLGLLTTGLPSVPEHGAGFPASRIATALDWEDLVLHPGTRRQIEEILTWMRHGRTLMDDWGMAAKLRPGCRALFYGPPGTGKTLAASLLGKSSGRDCYRIDLSLVVSKYIGETEKNLGRVFDQAEHKDWILFFDEADALFGRRTETRDAHDRYANQETSFLLQRIEVFDGIAILASNRRDNLDDAFSRRFESVIHFPMPRADERLLLWQRGFSPRARLAADLDLEAIARRHELTGGSIMNCIRQASLAAIAADEREIAAADLEQAIRRELAKEGRQG